MAYASDPSFMFTILSAGVCGTEAWS